MEQLHHTKASKATCPPCSFNPQRVQPFRALKYCSALEVLPLLLAHHCHCINIPWQLKLLNPAPYYVLACTPEGGLRHERPAAF